MNNVNKSTAIISSYESFATLDGTGIRFEIFFAGCPLRCVCCHNPETWERKGEEISAEDLLKKVLRYKPYFKNKGGVTLSGGEPLMQTSFLLNFIPLLKQNGISVALDTSGCVINHDVLKVIEMCDLILLDMKQNTEEKYKKYARGSLEQTLKFLSVCEEKNKDVWIRTVMIPNINNTKEDVIKFAEIVKNFKCVKKYDLLAFHTMGFSKYEKLGIENPLLNTKDLKIEELKKLKNILKANLQNVIVQ